MAQIRGLYLTAAASAAKLLAAPQVAAGWHEPSALPKLSVQGLAGHLAGQIFFIPKVLRALSRAERAPGSISAL